MEQIIYAIILGIIQGLSEFLPVSSSGHIELGKFFLDFEPEDSLLFTVVLHFATALSTVVVFRKDIWQLITGIFNPKDSENRLFALKIIVSMLPAAIIGVLFNDELEALFDRQIILVSICLYITGLLLFVADKAKATEGRVTFTNAIIIGIAQAIAILPGISRSGATIATSVLLKIERKQAARFSFLMVLPLIFGKMAKDTMDGTWVGGEVAIVPMVAGFIAAFVVGYFACTWMIRLVTNAQLKYFSYYCFAVATISIIWYSIAY